LPIVLRILFYANSIFIHFIRARRPQNFFCSYSWWLLHFFQWNWNSSIFFALHSISISSEFSSSRQRLNTKKLISNICRELGMEIFCASFWIHFHLINVEISIICIVWLFLYEENEILSYALMVLLRKGFKFGTQFSG